jgi:ubiquinone/menaquinone biosynthesis C-methylase UbiE
MKQLLVGGAGQQVTHETNEELATVPAFGIMELVYLARAYYIVARLNIADILAERPQTAEELAARTGTHSCSLYRVLRALAAFNILVENECGEFELTLDGKLLRNNVVGSIRDWTVFVGHDECWDAFGKALEVVKTGTDGFRLAYGKGMYELAGEPGHETFKESFISGMSSFTTWQCKVVVMAAHSFKGFKRMVDVAGGQGKLITKILQKNPDMHGVLFDQNFTVDMARKGFTDAGVADRCEFISGNIFDSVPTDGDGYLLKHVLRDWSDEESVKILRNIEKAMLPGGTLFLIDGIIDPRNGVDRVQKLIDLEQMFWLTGRLRTQKEWDDILDLAGLHRSTTIKTVISDTFIMVIQRKNEA